MRFGRGAKGIKMRNRVLRAGVFALALAALTGTACASGSYSGGGFTPPKTKNEAKPAETSSKPKKKKTSELSVHGAYSRKS